MLCFVLGVVGFFCVLLVNSDEEWSSSFWVLDPGTTKTTTSHDKRTSPPSSRYLAPFTNAAPCDHQNGDYTCTVHQPTPFEVPEQATQLVCDDAAVCLTTLHGLKEDPNQDRSIGISVVDNRNQQQKLLVAGLFDGHGMDGHHVSQFAMDQLPWRILANYWTNRHTTKNGTEEVERLFADCDNFLLDQTPFLGGSTGIVLLATAHNVYWASVGDSTGFLVEWPSGRIVSSVPAHKPNQPLERQRIEQHGGTVVDPPPGTPFSARAQYEEQFPDDPTMIGLVTLAMSRSLGDRGGKINARTQQRRPIVIPTPWTETVALADDNDQQYFAILATDGLMDMLPSPEYVVTTLGKALYYESNNDDNNVVGRVAAQLVQQASARWHAESMGQYRDDITLTVYKLR